MTQLGVDTDRMAKTQPEFARISAGVEKLRVALEAKLDGAGQCWGDDETGKAFEGNYLEPAQNLRQGLKDLVEVLTSVVDGITTMTKGADRAEQDAVDLAAAPAVNSGGA